MKEINLKDGWLMEAIKQAEEDRKTWCPQYREMMERLGTLNVRIH